MHMSGVQVYLGLFWVWVEALEQAFRLISTLATLILYINSVFIVILYMNSSYSHSLHKSYKH